MPSPPPASQAQGRKLGLACKGARSTSLLAYSGTVGVWYRTNLRYQLDLGCDALFFLFPARQTAVVEGLVS